MKQSLNALQIATCMPGIPKPQQRPANPQKWVKMPHFNGISGKTSHS
ncbi:hypothetical protein [Hydrogenophaga taeniospiralis]|nr:hypothetical protein [Hydrogenophaga taeniospiralis]